MWVASEIVLVIVCVGIICGISVLWNKIPGIVGLSLTRKSW